MRHVTRIGRTFIVNIMVRIPVDTLLTMILIQHRNNVHASLEFYEECTNF